MAAGDVTIDFTSDRAIRGVRLICGRVQLDGGNPTPVALGSYVREILGGTASLHTGAIPGDDPMGVTCGVSGTTLNIYAWKTNGTDPTPAASTDNTKEVAFVAWGKP